MTHFPHKPTIVENLTAHNKSFMVLLSSRGVPFPLHYLFSCSGDVFESFQFSWQFNHCVFFAASDSISVTSSTTSAISFDKHGLSASSSPGKKRHPLLISFLCIYKIEYLKCMHKAICDLISFLALILKTIGITFFRVFLIPVSSTRFLPAGLEWFQYRCRL